MPRGKVELKYIENDSNRRRSYMKRKHAVLKKAEELSILCNVPLCVILRSCFESTQISWPSHSGIQDVIQRFSEMPEDEQKKYQYNLESYYNKRLEQLQAQLKKQILENQAKQTFLRMEKCLTGQSSPGDYPEHLVELKSEIGKMTKELDIKSQSLRAQNPEMMMNESGTMNVEMPEGSQRPFHYLNDGPISPFPYDV